jgi:hypothetical protein
MLHPVMNHRVSTMKLVKHPTMMFLKAYGVQLWEVLPVTCVC